MSGDQVPQPDFDKHVPRDFPNEQSSTPVADFMDFRTMVIPQLIRWAFLIGLVLFPLTGLLLAMDAYLSEDINIMSKTSTAVLIAFAAPLGLRIACEIVIIPFRINETLTEISRHTR